MIKSAIKHSAIRSAIRHTFVPNDDGYREYITRAILNANGTQHVLLDSKITITGACEIEWQGQWPVSGGGWLFADIYDDDQNESRFLTNGSAISGFGFPSATPLTTIPDASVIHRYQYIRTGNSVGFYVNGNLLATTSYSGQLSFNSLFTKWASSSGIPKFSGIFYDLKIWTNGDRNTGDLILNVPFHESGSDYQRDLTSTITDVNDPDWRGAILQNALSEDWMQIEKKPAWDYWTNLFWPNLVDYSDDLRTWSKARIVATDFNDDYTTFEVTNPSAPYLYFYRADTAKLKEQKYKARMEVTGPAGVECWIGLLRDGATDFVYDAVVMTGEWQLLEFQHEFSAIPTNVIVRFDAATTDRGGSVGDIYKIRNAGLIPGDESSYKKTNGIAGRKLEIAQ